MGLWSGGGREGGEGESERLIWERRAEDGCVLFVYLGFFVLVDCVAEAFPEVWVAGDCHSCVSFLLTAPAIVFVVLTA